MTSPSDFAKNFDPYPVPRELSKLLAFQEEVGGFARYSAGFGLERDDKAGLKSWSEDPEFLARLLPFARANGTGSFYALWADGESKDTTSFPVVAFGDEGGAQVVAEDVRGLLTILGFDVEPSISDSGVWFDKPRGHRHSDNHDTYLLWLSELGLESAQDPATIIGAAQAKYRSSFEAWFARYYDENA